MKNYFKYNLYCLLTAIFLFSASYGDDRSSEIELSIEIYPKDSMRAVSILTNLYQSGNYKLLEIKNILFEKQSYNLYSEFLNIIPLSAESASEKMLMNFISPDDTDFTIDLDNYLKFYSLQSVVEKYAPFIVETNFIYRALTSLSNTNMFFILANSYIKFQKIDEFDRFLEMSEMRQTVPKVEVLEYIIRSWMIKQRDIRNLLKVYGLEEPDILTYSIASDFIRGDYEAVLNMTNWIIRETASNANNLKNIRIDLPYILAYSYFRTENYTQCLNWLEKVFFRNNYDLSELRFLCRLGNNDRFNAQKELFQMKAPDAYFFYSSFLECGNNITNGIHGMESYMLMKDFQKQFSLEAMLLVFTYYNNRENINAVINIIQKSLTYKRNISGIQAPLSHAYIFSKEDQYNPGLNEGQPASYEKEFIEYENSIRDIKDGKKIEAKKTLGELIKNAAASPVIKSLSLYEYRRLD